MGPKLNFDMETSKKESCSNTSNELLLTEKITRKLDQECANLKEKNEDQGAVGSTAKRMKMGTMKKEVIHQIIPVSVTGNIHNRDIA